MKLNEKYKKDELEYMIFVENLSYREIGRHYGVSDTYIKKICNKLGITLIIRSKFPENWSPHNKGKTEKKHCVNCDELYLSTHKYSKYCSKDCEIEHKINKKYEYYLNNQEEYKKIIDTKFLKRHILKEQNNCCDICQNTNTWNNKTLVFVLDHIDGNAANNLRNNLRLVCPNCDSQLDTYKSKNKNSARKERYIKNYKQQE